MNKKDESFKDFVLDQLRELDDIDARRMFGGFGLYRDETFFGIIHKDRVYFKIDDSTVGEYRKLIEINPKYVAAYFHAGQALEKLGRLDEARQTYRQGIEVSTQAGDLHTRSELEAVLDLLG